jgi:hypothetical protein
MPVTCSVLPPSHGHNERYLRGTFTQHDIYMYIYLYVYIYIYSDNEGAEIVIIAVYILSHARR